MYNSHHLDIIQALEVVSMYCVHIFIIYIYIHAIYTGTYSRIMSTFYFGSSSPWPHGIPSRSTKLASQRGKA